MSNETDFADKAASAAMATYREPGERAALRCAAGDAAHLCDAIAIAIEAEHRGRGGHISKRGQELAAIAKRCGDAIWAMRELVKVRDTETAE